MTAPARRRPEPVPTVDQLTPAEKLVHDALLSVAAFGDTLGTGRPVSFTATARTLTARVLAADRDRG